MVEAHSALRVLKSVLANQVDADVADGLGLLFHERMIGTAYDETPRNSVTFASTGGDGVHYGFLLRGSAIDDASPVVMTVPMADHPNRVVGRDLRHFLGLGMGSGYFALEQLQYDFEATVAELDRGDFVVLDSRERRALDSIADALEVKGWTDHGAELASLEAEFGAELDIARGI